jgi:solute carrier family 35, member E1
MVQLLSVAVYSGPMLTFLGVRTSKSDFTWKYYLKFIIPLAFGKFASSVAAHISIWKVPVSYAHTVKASMPLFTVVLSRLVQTSLLDDI